jgi:YebC/PmpR family DNA-binding regulatory protein
MAGHSKWAKVKRIKAVKDPRRSKVFSRITREISVAAKAGGDPTMNPRLRTLLGKAREANMPADNIKRAIQKGTGELPGVVFEEVSYEGYGPSGVAFIVRVTTDNKNRAAADVRAVFNRFGGHLAAAGAVAFQFLHAGQFLIAKDQTTEEALMEVALEAGADDVITTADGYEVRCHIHSFDLLAHALENKKIPTESAEIAYIPNNTVPITEAQTAKTILKLQDVLEELDDVSEVFSNEEISDSLAAE